MTSADPRAAVFDAPAPRIFTMPPSAPFLTALAETLSAACGLEQSASALADAVIFLPNRRAARSFAEELHAVARGLGRPALIAPEIRVLGDLEDEAPSPSPVDLSLGPVLSPARRRGALYRLVQAWRDAQGEPRLPPGAALAAADELAGLLDQAALGEDADWDRLKTIALDADLAEHWRVSADFLKIVAEQWPLYLDEHAASDPLARRLAAAEAQADAWRRASPAHPVIVAGSTGATPASRTLMRAVLELPKGAVVLPGLDPELSAAAWRDIADAPSHPQFALGRALERLGAAPADAASWPGAEEREDACARRRLVNEALAPATRTKDWTQRLTTLADAAGPEKLVADALQSLTLVEAEDQGDEAQLAALLLREALETPGRTAALVTPDAGLARRTSALLGRWDISVEPSAGRPLLQTSPGRYLALISRWARDPGDPVLLLAVLKHELTRLGRGADDIALAIAQLELGALRGPRRWGSLAELDARLADAPEAASLLADLGRAAGDWLSIFAGARVDGAAAAEAAARMAETLSSTPDTPGELRVWRGAAGAAAARYLEMLAELSDQIGPVDAELWPDFAEAAARDLMVPPGADLHPRLAIWGPLEARLQSRDLVVLGGLNEGGWPQAAQIDGFLPKRLRREIGLPDPEERIGLSAHDFAQLACGGDVVLLRAKRVDDKPAVASRWLWRLQTLAAAGLGDGEARDAALSPATGCDPRIWASALHQVETAPAREPPQPRPPATARPRRFSVSRVARLVRDPYAVYAGDILKLKASPPVGADPGPAERGTAVHQAIERFEAGEGAALEDLICEELRRAGQSAELTALEQPLWRRAAETYLNWRDKRRGEVVSQAVETTGRLTFAGLTPDGADITLQATADRIERLVDGSLAIIDFKTGAPKTKKQVLSGLEPQLPLEAAIAAAGGFDAVGSGDVSQLIYMGVSLSQSVGDARNGAPLDLDAGETAADALDGFKALVAAYADPNQPYRSKPRVQFAWSISDYDRLARRSEWMLDEGEE